MCVCVCVCVLIFIAPLHEVVCVMLTLMKTEEIDACLVKFLGKPGPMFAKFLGKLGPICFLVSAAGGDSTVHASQFEQCRECWVL